MGRHAEARSAGEWEVVQSGNAIGLSPLRFLSTAQTLRVQLALKSPLPSVCLPGALSAGRCRASQYPIAAMAEWHVSAPYQQQRHPAAQGGPAGGVEWYSAGTSAQYGASSYGGYDMSAAQSGAAYGSFEDEPPLLEGGACLAAARRAC